MALSSFSMVIGVVLYLFGFPLVLLREFVHPSFRIDELLGLGEKRMRRGRNRDAADGIFFSFERFFFFWL